MMAYANIHATDSKRGELFSHALRIFNFQFPIEIPLGRKRIIFCMRLISRRDFLHETRKLTDKRTYGQADIRTEGTYGQTDKHG